MSSSEKPFDNVAFRLRGNRCVLCSVWPPFATLYWPDVGAVAAEVGLPQTTATALGVPQVQGRFLTALATKGLQDSRFRPAKIGFKSDPEDICQREEQRQGYRQVSFLGHCSRELALDTLEVVVSQVRERGRIDVRFMQWDVLADWRVGRERIHEVSNYLRQTHQLKSQITLFSELRELDSDLWEFVYTHSDVRIGWVAADLIDCREVKQFQDYCRESAALNNLERMGDMGLWPHVVLPVSEANTAVLPELVLALLEASRGGSIEMSPVPFVAIETEADPPRIDAYADALLAIYRNPRIPLRLVSPLSWVATRLEAQVPLLSSPAAAGAELAVLPNGDLYAGEWAVGLERWLLGNVLGDPCDIRWERLDVLPEVFSKSLTPTSCRSCDWRYRCGGVDPSVMLLQERALSRPGNRPPPSDSSAGRPRPEADGGRIAEGPQLFDFYCAPRRALFEEMIWGTVEAAAQTANKQPRELLHLREDGIDFAPAKFAGSCRSRLPRLASGTT